MTDVASALDLIEEKKRGLAERYLQSLDLRILELENAAAELRRNPDQVDAMTRIGAVCHKLAGISESVGQQEIGRLAREIDALIFAKNARWIVFESILEDLLENLEGQLK